MWIAFLDSSVLFPVFTSNLLLFLSKSGLFDARWSADVHREWIESRIKRYPETDRLLLERKRSRMDAEFPNALVFGYELLIGEFDLPDVNDRHVAAAAERAGANVIVTDNVDDFQSEKLRLKIVAQTADDFIADQVHLTNVSSRLVAIALVRHKKSLTSSRPSWRQYFELLKARFPTAYTLINERDFKAIIRDVLISRDWIY